MVIMPLGLSEKSNEAWSLPRLTQQFVRWLFSLFDFLDIVMLLEILLIQMKCLKKRKCGFCGSCDTGAFWCQPCRKLKKGFITIKQEDKGYIKHCICYFTYAYVETTINDRYGLSFSPHAAFVLLGCPRAAGLMPSTALFQQLSQDRQLGGSNERGVAGVVVLGPSWESVSWHQRQAGTDAQALERFAGAVSKQPTEAVPSYARVLAPSETLWFLLKAFLTAKCFLHVLVEFLNHSSAVLTLTELSLFLITLASPFWNIFSSL